MRGFLSVWQVFESRFSSYGSGGAEQIGLTRFAMLCKLLGHWTAVRLGEGLRC